MNKIYTRYGIIDKEKQTYYKHCKPEHFMGIFQGFGISVSELDFLIKKGVKTVIIQYNGVKKVEILKSDINQWLESKKEYTFQSDDLQKFVSIRDMKEVN